MADTSIQVYNAYLEDDNCNMFFPYVGERSVLGLTHPQYIFKNKDKHLYGMVALYKFVDTGDAGYQQYLNEKIVVSGTTSTTKENATNPVVKSLTLDIAGFGTSGNIESANIKVTNNFDKYISNGHNSTETYMNVYGTKETWVSDDNKKYNGLGIWVDITNLIYVTTKTFISLSTNSCPIDTEHFPASYSAEYLSNANALADKNICNNVDTITSKSICTGVQSDQHINDYINNIYNIIGREPHRYPANTITYNPTYTPSAAGSEEIVAPFGTRVNNEEKIVAIDSVNKTFSVGTEGIYQLQIKNGFYLIQGETRLDVKVYINNEEIREMSYSTYLTSNQEGLTNPSKAIKNTFSTNAYTVHLKSTDRIKVTATWGNTTNLRTENETMVTITAMQFNMYQDNTPN